MNKLTILATAMIAVGAAAPAVAADLPARAPATYTKAPRSFRPPMTGAVSTSASTAAVQPARLTGPTMVASETKAATTRPAAPLVARSAIAGS